MKTAALSFLPPFLRPRAATTTIASTMLPAERGMLERMPERELQLGWFDWLTRHRRILYTIVAAFYVLTFNGLWRVGVDSALYRGLARSLVRGDGYVFAGEHHKHAYPGLPVMLAGIEKVVGESTAIPLAIIVLMALATLWLIDRLIALRYPLWVATVVTIGVGLNYRLIKQSQQIMTDVPFTFGVMLALYGLERLRLLPRGARWPAFARWASAMVSGLVIAAATRPTFGVLAGAVVAGSAFRVARSADGRRGLHLSILASALLVLLALFCVDPRTRGIKPWDGVYEQELIDRVGELPHTFLQRVEGLLSRDLNDIFFSQHMWYFAYPMALLVLVGGGLIVLRRDVVWGLMIFGLVAITLPLSTVPRYYIMVAPFLWLGWTILCCWGALKLRADHRGPALAIVLALPLYVNVARSISFIQEQRAPDIAWLRRGESRETAFYKEYRAGIVPKLQAIAKMIADHTTPKQTTIGPEGHVLAYYADRRVIGERTLFIDREAALSQWPRLVADAKPNYAIFPTSIYGDNDSMMRELIRRRILVAELEVAQVDGIVLAVASVRPPPAGVNWKTYKAPAESISRPAAKGSTSGPTTKRGSTMRKGAATQRSDLIAARERRELREAREQRLQKAERQAKLQRQAKAERQAKQAKIERRQKAEKQAKIDRREKLERQKRLDHQKKIAKQKKHAPPTTGAGTR